MKSGGVINRAENSDFMKIAELDRNSWGSDEVNRYIPDGEHVWRLWVEYSVVYCCYENKSIIGAALAFPTMDNLFVVHKIFVSPGRRGNNLGTKLFLALVDELDNLKVDSFLTVSPDNDAAIKLYKKFGYREERFCKGYYRESEDRIIMLRNYSHSF